MAVMELIAAAENGNVSEVKRLVAQGADVNVQADDGVRPLHEAAEEGHVEVVATLLQLGADVNVQTTDGWRPLHSAAQEGHVEVVATLLQLGADVHAITIDGDTALHCASIAAAVALLLQAGAELHRRNNKGNTPLYEAIHDGRLKAVKALVQAGALPQASDGEWWTALLVGAVTGDEAAMTELIAASEELTRRMNENGHYARTAEQLAELSTDYRREMMHYGCALAAAQP